MEIFQQIMLFLSKAIWVYIAVITIWIIVGWIIFLGQPNRFHWVEEIQRILGSVIDPYLNIFKRIPGLQVGMISFYAFAGILVLVFFRKLLLFLATGFFPTAWYIVVEVLNISWILIASMLGLYAIIMIVRLITLYSMKNSQSEILDHLDRFLFPRVARLMGRFTKKAVPYPIALGFNTALIFLFLTGISLLLNQLLFPFLKSL